MASGGAHRPAQRRLWVIFQIFIKHSPTASEKLRFSSPVGATQDQLKGRTMRVMGVSSTMPGSGMGRSMGGFRRRGGSPMEIAAFLITSGFV